MVDLVVTLEWGLRLRGLLFTSGATVSSATGRRSPGVPLSTRLRLGATKAGKPAAGMYETEIEDYSPSFRNASRDRIPVRSGGMPPDLFQPTSSRLGVRYMTGFGMFSIPGSSGPSRGFWRSLGGSNVRRDGDCRGIPRDSPRFWAATLGYTIEEGPPADGPEDERNAWASLADPDGTRPGMFFQRVPEGKVVKNRMHLDVEIGGEGSYEERRAANEAERYRLVSLGATAHRGAHDVPPAFWIRMNDPEGNEFCLV